MENSARYQGPEPQRLLSMQQVLHYEVKSSWWACWISNETLQDLASSYFAWKVRRKFNRYRNNTLSFTAGSMGVRAKPVPPTLPDLQRYSHLPNLSLTAALSLLK